MTNNLQIYTTRFDLAALAWGNKGDSPVLAIHGWLDNAASFLPLEPYLSKINTVALDMPGPGYSQHRGVGEFYPFLDYVSVIHDVVEHLGGGWIYFIGSLIRRRHRQFLRGAFSRESVKSRFARRFGTIKRKSGWCPTKT